MVAVARPAPVRPANLFTREDIHGDLVLDADVVIVGSGAGGATLAAELAEGGLDVVVLEEGPFVTTGSFNADASGAVRRLYRDGGATLAIGNPPVLYQEGRAVGGSTVVNGGMSWRTPEKILDRWHREAGLDGVRAKEMEYFFERVERRIHVRHQDPESIGIDNALLKKGADAKGWKVIPNLRNQVHCAGSNNCAFGCPTGAKQSALVSYVPRALHFGARLYADVKVGAITRHGKRATGVTGEVRGLDGQRHKITVRAKLVASACGAIHSPALLHRSGFVSPSGQLGHNLSLHPNTKVVAIFDEPVRGWEGVHQAYQVREFQDEGFLFAAVNIPPGILAMTTRHWGPELGELMSQYDRMVVAGMLVEDTNTGRVATLGGRPQAFYQLSDFDADKLKRGVALLSELLFAAGAKKILLPFAGVPDLTGPDDVRKIFSADVPKKSIEVVTVHMMGTARMGSDRSRSVTDGFGMVHDADGLMVCDASLFPTPIGVNPMETIQALATRAAANILENPGRTAVNAAEAWLRAAATSAPSNRASAEQRALGASSARDLEIAFQRGVTPDLDALVGWELRGLNTPRWARLAGIQKFMKGFFRDPSRGGDVYGYNCPVAQNGLDGPWLARPDDAAPKRFGFYRVAPVNPTVRDNAYLHAVLLDYGKGGNSALDPTQGLRDYLVQVTADNPDLYLGKAYYALGPARVATSFFVLERQRPGIRELARF